MKESAQFINELLLTSKLLVVNPKQMFLPGADNSQQKSDRRLYPLKWYLQVIVSPLQIIIFSGYWVGFTFWRHL